MKKVLLACVTCVSLLGNQGFAQSADHGHLLMVWIGIAQSQTLSITTFEGDNSFERCEAAKTALGNIHSNFRGEWVQCVAF